tara:strand:+ start:160 stop:546 length:387 start_codon:yes stop_codon:yes gene_type:complete
MEIIKTEAIGSQIRKVRVKKGITQEEIAEKLSLSQSSYSKLENGEIIIDIERLQEIATILDVPNSDFIPHSDKRDKTQLYSVKGNKIEYFQVDGRKLLKEKNERIKYLEKENNYLRKLLEKHLKVKVK